MNTLQRGGFVLKSLIVATLVFTVTVPSASAHAVGQTLGDFYSGFLHPFSVLVYALPLLVLSIFVGQQGKVKTRRSMAVFIVALISGLAFPSVQDQARIFIALNYASFIFLGISVAASFRAPSLLLFTVVGIFAFTFGYLVGFELPLAASPFLFAIGVITGFVMLLIWIAAVTLSIQKYWFQLGLRVVGSWVAAIGLLLMGLYL